MWRLAARLSGRQQIQLQINLLFRQPASPAAAAETAAPRLSWRFSSRAKTSGRPGREAKRERFLLDCFQSRRPQTPAGLHSNLTAVGAGARHRRALKGSSIRPAPRRRGRGKPAVSRKTRHQDVLWLVWRARTAAAPPGTISESRKALGALIEREGWQWWWRRRRWRRAARLRQTKKSSAAGLN